MWTRFGDLDHTLAWMDEVRRKMDRVWEDYDNPWSAAAPRFARAAQWPRLNLFDGGPNLVLQADVPGMTDSDVQLTLHDDTLTLSGERKVDAPQGYSVHRQERSAVKFSRSIALPCKVDAEKTSALVRNGVLTVTLAKAPEARPRQIAVRA